MDANPLTPDLLAYFGAGCMVEHMENLKPDKEVLITPIMTGDASWRVPSGTIVRVLSPVGSYWRGKLAEPDAMYVGRPDLVFTACHFDEDRHKGDYYSEFDEPMVEEVRLLSALALAIGWDAGSVSFYPHHWSIRLPAKVDLTDRRAEAELSRLIRGSAIGGDYVLLTDPPLPPAHGGPPYQFRNAPMPRALQRRILRHIDPTDHLLARGLAAWLKGSMLMYHRTFTLESLYSLYVSMDASFSLVRRKLRAEGIKNPDAWDAGEYLSRAEGRGDCDTAYFEDFYAERVATLHPESRYGVFPYAPVKNCDAHCLITDLREVFRLLILGEVVDPDNHPVVEALHVHVPSPDSTPDPASLQ